MDVYENVLDMNEIGSALTENFFFFQFFVLSVCVILTLILTSFCPREQGNSEPV